MREANFFQLSVKLKISPRERNLCVTVLLETQIWRSQSVFYNH